MRHDCLAITSVTFQTNLKMCILYVLYEYIISRLVNIYYMYVTVCIAQNIFKLRKHEARLILMILVEFQINLKTSVSYVLRKRYLYYPVQFIRPLPTF